MTNYAFVLDANGKQLASTKEIKAWYLIRKKRATLVSKYPMVIQLNKIVPDNFQENTAARLSLKKPKRCV